MADPLGYVPVVATVLAIPQFLPQIVKVRTTGDTTGVSWLWAALTSVNNAAWFGYFVLSRLWGGLVPASSAVLLAGALAMLPACRREATSNAALLITAWSAVLVTAFLVAGRTGLGTLLTAAFAIQVAPSIWAAYRTARPTGISRGTWLLILGELSCWALYGIHESDPRLIALGTLGIVASVLMLARTCSGPGVSGPSARGRGWSRSFHRRRRCGS